MLVFLTRAPARRLFFVSCPSFMPCVSRCVELYVMDRPQLYAKKEKKAQWF